MIGGDFRWLVLASRTSVLTNEGLEEGKSYACSDGSNEEVLEFSNASPRS